LIAINESADEGEFETYEVTNKELNIVDDKEYHRR
jgi:hypothetical protein